VNNFGDYRSEDYANEKQLSDAIQSLIFLRFGHKRESMCAGGRSRVDFFLKRLDIYLEAKVSTESSCIDRALGQALRYKVIDKKETWIITPNDVGLSDEQMQVAESIGVRFLKINELITELEERDSKRRGLEVV
jgi:hypothetical protein